MDVDDLRSLMHTGTVRLLSERIIGSYPQLAGRLALTVSVWG